MGWQEDYYGKKVYKSEKTKAAAQKTKKKTETRKQATYDAALSKQATDYSKKYGLTDDANLRNAINKAMTNKKRVTDYNKLNEKHQAAWKEKSNKSGNEDYHKVDEYDRKDYDNKRKEMGLSKTEGPISNATYDAFLSKYHASEKDKSLQFMKDIKNGYGTKGKSFAQKHPWIHNTLTFGTSREKTKINHVEPPKGEKKKPKDSKNIYKNYLNNQLFNLPSLLEEKVTKKKPDYLKDEVARKMGEQSSSDQDKINLAMGGTALAKQGLKPLVRNLVSKKGIGTATLGAAGGTAEGYLGNKYQEQLGNKLTDKEKHKNIGQSAALGALLGKAVGGYSKAPRDYTPTRTPEEVRASKLKKFELKKVADELKYGQNKQLTLPAPKEKQAKLRKTVEYTLGGKYKGKQKQQEPLRTLVEEMPKNTRIKTAKEMLNDYLNEYRSNNPEPKYEVGPAKLLGLPAPKKKVFDYDGEKKELGTIHKLGREEFAIKNAPEIDAIRQVREQELVRREMEFESHVEMANEFKHIQNTHGRRLNIPDANRSDFAQLLPNALKHASGKGEGDDIYRVAQDAGFDSVEGFINHYLKAFESHKIAQGGLNKYLRDNVREHPDTVLDDLYEQSEIARTTRKALEELEQKKVEFDTKEPEPKNDYRSGNVSDESKLEHYKTVVLPGIEDELAQTKSLVRKSQLDVQKHTVTQAIEKLQKEIDELNHHMETTKKPDYNAIATKRAELYAKKLEVEQATKNLSTKDKEVVRLLDEQLQKYADEGDQVNYDVLNRKKEEFVQSKAPAPKKDAYDERIENANKFKADVRKVDKDLYYDTKTNLYYTKDEINKALTNFDGHREDTAGYKVGEVVQYYYTNGAGEKFPSNTGIITGFKTMPTGKIMVHVQSPNESYGTSGGWVDIDKIEQKFTDGAEISKNLRALNENISNPDYYPGFMGDSDHNKNIFDSTGNRHKVMNKANRRYKHFAEKPAPKKKEKPKKLKTTDKPIKPSTPDPSREEIASWKQKPEDELTQYQKNWVDSDNARIELEKKPIEKTLKKMKEKKETPAKVKKDINERQDAIMNSLKNDKKAYDQFMKSKDRKSGYTLKQFEEFLSKWEKKIGINSDVHPVFDKILTNFKESTISKEELKDRSTTEKYMSLTPNDADIKAIAKAKPPSVLLAFDKWAKNRKTLKDRKQNKSIKQLIDDLGYEPENIILDSGAYAFDKKKPGIYDDVEKAFDEIYGQLDSEEIGMVIQNDLYQVAHEGLSDANEFIKYIHWAQSQSLYIKKSKLHIMNFDKIGDPDLSYATWKALSNTIDNVVPVYHHGSDVSYLEQYIKEGADYIALGGSAKYSPKKRAAWANELMKKYPKVKFHMLGTMSTDLMDKSPDLHSLDGSGWVDTSGGQTKEQKIDNTTKKISDILNHKDRRNELTGKLPGEHNTQFQKEYRAAKTNKDKFAVLDKWDGKVREIADAEIKSKYDEHMAKTEHQQKILTKLENFFKVADGDLSQEEIDHLMKEFGDDETSAGLEKTNRKKRPFQNTIQEDQLKFEKGEVKQPNNDKPKTGGIKNLKVNGKLVKEQLEFKNGKVTSRTEESFTRPKGAHKPKTVFEDQLTHANGKITQPNAERNKTGVNKAYSPKIDGQQEIDLNTGKISVDQSEKLALELEGEYKGLKDIKWGQGNALNLIELIQKLPERVSHKLQESLFKGKEDNVNMMIEESANFMKKVVAKDGLGIKKGSKNSKLVQQYGEGIITLDQLKKESPKDWNKIRHANKFFQDKYNEYIDELNKRRAKIGKAPVQKRSDFYQHMQDLDGLDNVKNTTFNSSGVDVRNDPHLEGRSSWVKPKGMKDAAWQKIVKGKELYKEDAVGNFLGFLKGASHSIHLEPVIHDLKGVHAALEDATKGTVKAERLKRALQKHINDLSGRTNESDKSFHDVADSKRIVSVLHKTNSRVQGNMIKGNIGSLIGQLGGLPVNIAKANPWNSAKGLVRTTADLGNRIIGNGDKLAIKQSKFHKERYVHQHFERFNSRLIDQPGKLADWALNTVDKGVFHFTWNAMYEKGLKAKVADPIKYADNETRHVMAGRGVGEVPLFHKSLPGKVLASFSYEMGNQWKVLGGIAKNPKERANLLTYVFAAYALNRASEETRGSSVTFDPLDAVIDGYTQTEGKVIRKVAGSIGSLLGEAIGSVPGGGFLISLIDEHNVPFTDDKVKYKDVFGNRNPDRYGSGIVATKGLSNPLYYLAPFGAAQYEKSKKGLKAIDEQGVYGTNSKGERVMKYPIETKGILKKAQLFAFGTGSADESREYYKNKKRPADLSVDQTRRVEGAYNKVQEYKNIMAERKRKREKENR